MDAQLVWNTWRRLLTSDPLVDWVLSPESRTGDPEGLTADELAILADYASTPAATAQNIGMYRRGLTRNVLGGLDLVPLTRRLLYASGLDVDEVATAAARFAGYHDNGPNFWRTAADVLDYLASLPEFASPAQQDVLAIDAATAALARRLSESAPAVWPDDIAALAGDAAASTAPLEAAAGSDTRGESGRYVATSAAVVVATSCDLTAWIIDPFDFDPADELEPSPRQWLIYFPAAEAAHEYAQLSERAARAFVLLRTPRTAAELGSALGGLSEADAHAVIGSLAGLGVVGREAELTAQPSQEGQPADPAQLAPQWADGVAIR